MATTEGDPAPELTGLLRVLQFGDSALPVGGFSFSNGLESAVQHGIVHDRATLAEFVQTATRQAATLDGVALLVAHRAATAGDLAGVIAADCALYQRKLNEETRTMTTRMGRKLAELGDRLVARPLLAAWLAGVKAGTTPGTYPVALALVMSSLGVDGRETFAMHHYGVASMILGAALRLLRLSYVDTQAILLAVNATAEDAYARAAACRLEEMHGFAPLLDILAAAHVRAHVRLFMN